MMSSNNNKINTFAKVTSAMLLSSLVLASCNMVNSSQQGLEKDSNVLEITSEVNALNDEKKDRDKVQKETYPEPGVKNKDQVPKDTADNDFEQREIMEEDFNFADTLPEDVKKAIEGVDFKSFHLDKNAPKQIADVDSPFVLASKSSFFPDDFKPKTLTEPKIPFSFGNKKDEKRNLQKIAADAITELITQANSEKIYIYGVSGYRSIARQRVIYKYNVDNYGQAHADKYSAKPMYSEHHTGLCMDVSSKSVGFDLVEKYGDTKEGKWLAQNAHKFGFIIRYPKGKEEITGYSYEPWHIRYLGIPLATYLYENNLCYEEFIEKMQGSLQSGEVQNEKNNNNNN